MPISGAFGENLLGQGIVGEIRPSKIDFIQSGSGIWKVGKAVRNSFSQFLSGTLPAHTAATVDALAFNNDAKLDPELKGFLRATGTIHIISTSGMHVMMLAWAIMLLLSRLPISRLVQIFVLGVLLLLYVAAAGWRPPAVRAVVLILAMLLPYQFDRQPDALSALSLAYLLAVIINPIDILDIGLELSYISLLGLVLFGGYSNEEHPQLWDTVKHRFWMTLRMSCVASLATIPLSAYFFGQFSTIAPIANLAVAFVVLPIVAAALVAWPISWPFPAIGSLILLGVGTLANYIEAATSWMSTWPGAVVQIEQFSGYWLAGFYFLMILLWGPQKRDPLANHSYPP
ncbi:MAG: ComEC/Rec2 family competence protein [Armatimonadetes bacterium]|nr:ComEC/Rec2 family competence protein [Armatimonadota bacterium]